MAIAANRCSHGERTFHVNYNGVCNHRSISELSVHNCTMSEGERRGHQVHRLERTILQLLISVSLKWNGNKLAALNNWISIHYSLMKWVEWGTNLSDKQMQWKLWMKWMSKWANQASRIKMLLMDAIVDSLRQVFSLLNFQVARRRIDRVPVNLSVFTFDWCHR